MSEDLVGSTFSLVSRTEAVHSYATKVGALADRCHDSAPGWVSDKLSIQAP